MLNKIIYIPVVAFILSTTVEEKINGQKYYPDVCPVILDSDGYWTSSFNDDYSSSNRPIGITTAAPETYEVNGIMPDDSWRRLGFEYPGNKAFNQDWKEIYEKVLDKWKLEQKDKRFK